MSSQEAVRAAHERVLATERRTLRLSLAGTAVVSLLGIGWGLAVSSQLIVFDGIYAVIGLALSALTLRVTSLVRQEPSHRYPFGREGLGPLVVGVQGLVLVGALAFAAVDAVMVILDGGSHTEFGWALGYALVSLVIAVAIYGVLRRHTADSELVGAEAAQWFAGVLLSVAMLVGFGAALAMDRTEWSALAAYADPLLVIAVAAALAPTPLRMLRTTARELLEGAPGPAVEGPTREAVAATCATFNLPEPASLRLGKLGRKVYVEIDFLLPDGSLTVATADRIRRDLRARLAAPGQSLWLNVEFHADPDWDS